MTRKANIFSFDDARTASQSRRAQQSSSPQAASRGRYVDDQPLRMPTSRDARMMRSTRAADLYYYDEEEWQEETADESVVSRRVETKRERRKRERTKARADKMFTKQFEGNAPSSDPAEGAPRAALYEGKMGSSHRKSARMQRASSAMPQTAKLNPAGWFSNLHVSPRGLKVGTAVLCLVLVAVFLYTPAQQYYQAQREHDKLAAEYAELEQRNETLGSQNTALSSNAGMEDAVREKYGYVKKGDETAVVTGLSETTTDSSRDGENIEANVLSSAVKAPEEWYTPYLDAFFGVS